MSKEKSMQERLTKAFQEVGALYVTWGYPESSSQDIVEVDMVEDGNGRTSPSYSHDLLERDLVHIITGFVGLEVLAHESMQLLESNADMPEEDRRVCNLAVQLLASLVSFYSLTHMTRHPDIQALAKMTFLSPGSEVARAVVEEGVRHYIHEAGHKFGWDTASWQDLAELGGEVPSHRVPDFTGVIRTITDASEIFQALARQAVEENRISAFTHDDLNLMDSDPLLIELIQPSEVFNEAVEDGISDNWRSRMLDYYTEPFPGAHESGKAWDQWGKSAFDFSSCLGASPRCLAELRGMLFGIYPDRQAKPHLVLEVPEDDELGAVRNYYSFPVGDLDESALGVLQGQMVVVAREGDSYLVREEQDMQASPSM